MKLRVNGAELCVSGGQELGLFQVVVGSEGKWHHVAFDCSELEKCFGHAEEVASALSTRLIFPKDCSVSCLETFSLSGYDGFLISELFFCPFLQFQGQFTNSLPSGQGDSVECSSDDSVLP